MRSGVTLVIPTIPPRHEMLTRAVASAVKQRRSFQGIIITIDTERRGAGPTRTRGMHQVETEWTAFLDDDDELYPRHVDQLLDAAEESGADLVFPWFDVAGGGDPFPQFEGLEWDPDNPHMFPVTVLARTELLHASHGFPLAGAEGDDWPLWQELFSMGAKIHHLNKRTWKWHHHGANTSGRPDRW